MKSLESVVAQVLRVNPSSVTDETAMRSTPAWDSLAHMEMVAAVEAAYPVRLSMDEIVEITSVTGLRTLLRRHGIDA